MLPQEFAIFVQRECAAQGGDFTHGLDDSSIDVKAKDLDQVVDITFSMDWCKLEILCVGCKLATIVPTTSV